MSRKENSAKNALSGIFREILINVLKFVTRTVFIATLGKSYLGINGLFTNILQMLSLTELGLGSAMNYRLYKPLADKDEEQIIILMKFYKNAYHLIGVAIMVLGMALIPFLPKLIKDYDSLSILGINPVIIYLLYLGQSACTYFFAAYKSALIKADQKEYKITVVGYGVSIISYMTQILILVFWGDFTAFTASMILFATLENLINAYIVDKNYPFLKNKTDKNLPKKTVKDIIKDCSVLFLYQTNQVVVNATDNIVLSTAIGLVIVGEYSNYMMIYNTIKIVLIRAMDAVKNSLGNLRAVASIEKQYDFFKIMNFLVAFAYGMAAAGIYVIGDSFVQSWIGSDYILGTTFCMLLAIEIYIQGCRQLVGTYRNAMGLFQHGKFRPLVQMILNVVISVALVKPLKLYGVMLGTILSDCLTWVWFDPIIIYQYGFKEYRPVREYFFTNLKYILLTVVTAVASKYACMLLGFGGWLTVILKMIIVIVITIIIFTLFNFKTKEFEYLKSTVSQAGKKIKRKLVGGKS